MVTPYSARPLLAKYSIIGICWALPIRYLTATYSNPAP